MARSLTEALLAIQEKVPAFQRNAINPYHNSRYTSLDKILDEVLPLLQEHEVLWQTFPCYGPNGHPALRYRFTHTPTGEVEEEVMPLVLSKGTPQDQGSAITYARRYSLVAALALVIDQDDDGTAATEAATKAGASLPANTTKAATDGASMTSEQQVELREVITQLKTELQKHPEEWAKVAQWATQREIDLDAPPADKLRAVERALRRKLESLPSK